ncbi:MAG: response regulator transcription factor, partial [Acidobacteriota bacterium]|nr:response regulator transcription factor [Acidobacteriota bacterium]
KMDSRTKVLIRCRNRLLAQLIHRMLSKKTEFDAVALEGQFGPMDCGHSPARSVVVLDSLDFFLERSKADSSRGSDAGAVKYLLIAMEDDHGDFLAAVRCGVLGYVLQDASAADILAAVRAVAAGQATCPPGYMAVLFNYIAGRSDKSRKGRGRGQWGLTRREQQVIPLIGRGLTNKEIAAHFNLSERTVKNHIHRILKKVGASDRLDLYEVWQNRAAPTGGTMAN